MKNYIVYDIGGTAVKWSIINEAGEIIISDKISIAKTVEEFFKLLIENVNANKEEYLLQGIAISAPGAVDCETGIIGGASAIPYIHGPNFKEILTEGTGLSVAIENDANCAALGECWIGSAKESNDVAFVVCGSGIGGAIVKDKKIHSGANKHGGEFGYCIVDVQDDEFLSWSTVGSTQALVRSVAKGKGLNEEEVDGVKVFELYEAGDKVAVEAVNKYFMYMAIGIYNTQYTYDPEMIVLGGAISEREDFVDEINKRIDIIMEKNKDGKIRPIIKKSSKGNDANKFGALFNYLQRNN